MSDPLVFTLYDYDVPGKASPRVVRVHGRSMSFLPRQTQTAMVKIIAYLRLWYGSRPPLAGPLRLEVLKASSPPKGAKQDRAWWSTKKPDGDNVLKLVADCLVKAGVIADDRMISDWRCSKIITPPGVASFLGIRITELTAENHCDLLDMMVGDQKLIESSKKELTRGNQ